MKIYIKIAIFLTLSFCYKNVNAQFYSTGQDPATTKWEQINTDNFQIIFQKDFSDKAQYVANTLEFHYSKVGNSLNHKPKKVSVIIHNQTIRANGYVAWAPKRMELYTTPSQDSYPDIWLKHLCIHEFRHVVQIDKLNQGITNILRIVFGQQATALVAAQLPFWYLEGDAVCTETVFSDFGRGRLPYFHQGLKTHLLSDDEQFSFDKMLFGSYKEYTPNRYELGYQLTSFARMKYGSEIWSNVQNYVARNSYTLLPTNFSFYRGLKKNTGLSQKELYEETSVFLDSLWTKENDANHTLPAKFIQDYSVNEYADYLNPISINKNEFIALKKSYSHIPQFVILNNDSERILYEPGVLLSNDFSFSNNILVWAEYKPDARWKNREFNSIRLLNIQTGIDFTLIEKSRYFSPAISTSTEKIVVVEVDEMNQASLVVLNSFNGKVLYKIASRNGNFLQRPKWSTDEQAIFVIELSDKGKQIVKYNFEKEQWQTILSLPNADIQRVLPTKDKVYFHSTLNGTDNIYVFDEITKDIYQISNSRFGISGFDINANNSKLIVNEKTSQGFRLAEIPVERAMWRKVDIEEKYHFQLAEIITSQEKEQLDSSSFKQKEFTKKPYRKPLHLFNFHSWIPFYFDYESLSLNNIANLPSELSNNLYPGLMLLSQNKLSSVESILSYAYKNGNHFLSSSIELKGQYPILRLSAEYGNEQLIRGTSVATWQPESRIGYRYKADLYVPFNFSKGKYIKGFIPLVSVEYSDNIYYNFTDDYYIKGIEFVQTQLLYYAYERPAKKDIIPKLGAIFQFNLFNTPFETELYNYLYSVNSLFYLPGGINKGFSIDFGYQFQKPNLYLFNSNFSFPRGLLQTRTEKMVKLYTDYVFPIAYPEWNLGSVLYLKRLRGDLFIDYAFNSYRTKDSDDGSVYWLNQNKLSIGFELKADYHLLRTIFPLNTGVRIGFAPIEGKFIYNVLFGIDLNNL
jgi:hypothetical protein